MQRLILVALLSWSAVAICQEEDATSRLHFAGGAGIELKAQQDVNPDSMTPRFLPQGFIQLKKRAFTLMTDLSHEQSRTSSGSLSITSQTWNLGFWGRYDLLQGQILSPFVSLGVGMLFDQVDTQFLGERDERSGRRRFFGGGLGLSKVLGEHFLIEGEYRAALTEDRKDISHLGIVRLGLVL